ncbi:MAG TPA: NAD(P)/FAD-dependent oxidoreductase, partial [Actinomycetota bacterium]|nr:NAD(P)/FAD-dependent oxidoreductase [Actinomycetota bacterium]
RRLPVRVVDRIALILQRLTDGEALEDQGDPILDVGLIGLLKKRRVGVFPAVERLDGPDVVLDGGRRLRPDAVIWATGFQRGLERLVGHLGAASGRPAVHGAATHPAAPGLHFIGFSNPISGNLRETAIDAKRIARAVRRRRQPAAS